MKILMTADTVGGVWRYAMELARGLAAFGADIVLATMGGRLSTDQRRDVLALDNLTVFESEYKLIWMEDPWGDVFASGKWLLHLARQWRPDIVHLNDYPHGALPWPAPVLMAGHSCVLSWWQAVHGEAAPERFQRYRETVTAGLHSARLVVAPTRAMLNELDRHYGPLPPSRVVPNGSGAPPAAAEAKQPLVLAAGRLWDGAKNIAALARVAPRLPWPVYVAGETDHPDGGCAQFTNVRLLGRLSPQALAVWLRRAAVYALPARYEPFGLSVLEAALSGCALVLGDIASLREVWRDAAIYVPAGDDDALVRAIGDLAADEALRQSWAGKAQARANAYSRERMAAGYWHAYRSVAALPVGKRRTTGVTG